MSDDKQAWPSKRDWQRQYDATRLRDVPFETMSGVPVEPVIWIEIVSGVGSSKREHPVDAKTAARTAEKTLVLFMVEKLTTPLKKARRIRT